MPHRLGVAALPVRRSCNRIIAYSPRGTYNATRRLHMNRITTDRIQKELTIKAPRSRVWRAIAEPLEFGAWFGVDMTGVEFKAHQPVQGKMTYPGYEGLPFKMEIDRIEPE